MRPQDLKQYIDTITTALSPLGEKAQAAFSLYYRAAYRQAILDGLEDLLLTTASALAVVLLWKWFLRIRGSLEPEKTSYMDFAQRGFYQFWVIAATFVLCGLAIGTLDHALDCLVNPDFRAINTVLAARK